KPAPRPMTPMICRWEGSFLSVFPFQHPGRMSDPDQEHRILAGFSRGGVHGPAGVLLQHVINVLETGYIALPDAIDSLVKPSNSRAESNSGITDLSTGFQSVDCSPKRVIINLLHPDIVQLQKIDVIGLETFQGCFRIAH